MALLIINDPGCWSEGVDNAKHVLEFDTFSVEELSPERRKEIKAAVNEMFEKLDMIYEHLHMNFEDECDECGQQFQPENLEKKRCIRCENRYEGYERQAHNEETMREWHAYNASKVIKRDGLESFKAAGMPIPFGLCNSCWEPVPPEEWYTKAPVVLCKNCSSGLTSESFAADRSPEAELREGALNRGQP